MQWERIFSQEPLLRNNSLFFHLNDLCPTLILFSQFFILCEDVLNVKVLSSTFPQFSVLHYSDPLTHLYHSLRNASA